MPTEATKDALVAAAQAYRAEVNEEIPNSPGNTLWLDWNGEYVAMSNREDHKEIIIDTVVTIEN